MFVFLLFFFSCWFSFLFSVDLIGLSPAAGEGLRSKRRETNQWPTGVSFFFSFFLLPASAAWCRRSVSLDVLDLIDLIYFCF